MSEINNSILENIKTALAQALNLSDSSKILPQTRLKEELKLDSMTSLTFLMALEESIPGFQVDPDTLTESALETVETVTQYVESSLKK
jgi:acyl carrier protein